MNSSQTLLDQLLALQRSLQEESLQRWQRFLALPQLAERTRELAVRTTPHDVVYQEGTLQLLRYRREQPLEWAEPILLCYALVNRPYILDLQPRRSVVRQLLRHGFEVYLIDWGVPTAADQQLRLHDYVEGFLKHVTDFVRCTAGGAQLNLLGYCMGGTLSTLYAALHPEEICSLTLMATPIDFGGEESLLNVWANAEYFDVDALIDAFGNCPGEFLRACFQMTRPVQNLLEKYAGFLERMDDDEFVEHFVAMEQWGQDSIPVAGETFREFVKRFYQQNQLVQGTFQLNGEPVRLERITCPLLLLVAEHDHLVPPRSSWALRDHVTSREIHALSVNAGHVGLAVSSKAHAELWPEAARWIARQSTALDVKPTSLNP